MKNSQLNKALREIERLIRAHSGGHSEVSLNAWLNYSTLRRFQEWVPRPAPGETRLLDIGCYQPTISVYAALGWREVIGIAKEEGECNASSFYQTENGTPAKNLILDVEVERIPEPDGSIDVVLMMEVFEHFGLDPMQALAEVNRVLKPSGLLVFSTPNAVAFGNMRRMMHGREPYGGLEFSGFSTNRHNRIYDAEELLRVMEAAGFEVEVCTSRSYSDPRPGWRMSVLSMLWKCNDARIQLRTGRRIERGAYLAGKTRQNWCQGRAPWQLRHLPDGRGRGAEGIVPRDSAADRGTTTTATTSACVRPPMVMRSRATDGGVRPNASKKGQTGPSTTVRAARGDGSCPNCASALQEGGKTASIHGSSGLIWRIPANAGFDLVQHGKAQESGGASAANHFFARTRAAS